MFSFRVDKMFLEIWRLYIPVTSKEYNVLIIINNEKRDDRVKSVTCSIRNDNGNAFLFFFR